jgi:hypothetical protein
VDRNLSPYIELGVIAMGLQLNICQILTALLIGLWLSPGYACSVGRPTEAVVVAEASSIFRARITEVKLVRTGKGEKLEAKFELNERLKGRVPSTSFLTSYVPQAGECGAMYLMTGVEYVIVLDENGEMSGRSLPLGPDLPGLRASLEEIRRILATK